LAAAKGRWSSAPPYMSNLVFSARLPLLPVYCFWHLFDSSVSSFNSLINRKPTRQKT